MSRIIVTNKQRNLILHSEAAKEEFQDLYEFLKMNEELRTNDLNVYKQFEHIESYYDQLLRECQSEWEIPKTNAVNDLGNEYRKLKKECELCNQKNIRYEFKIVNEINKKSMIVGSECAKEFGSVLQGALQDEFKNVKRASKTRDIEKEIPGIRSYTENSHRFINTLDIIIPKSLDRKWTELSRKITKQYNKFVNDKNSNIGEIKSLWCNKDLLLKEINKYISDNKEEKYIADKNILNWLLEHREFETIEMIKEDKGYVRWRTSHRIYEESHMKEIALDLAPIFNKIGIYPQNVNRNTKRVSLQFHKDNNSLKAQIRFDTLVLNYGGVLFGNIIDFTFEDIYNECLIEDNESRDKIISLTNNSDYRLMKKYMDDKELIYTSKGNYLLCNLDKVVAEFKKHYFSSALDKHKTSRIIKSIAEKSMNKKQFELYEEIKEEARNMDKPEY